MANGRLIILIGPSGAGKTTIMKEMLKRFGDKLNFYPTYTTRPKRENEIEGKDYFFLEKKIFLKMKNDDFFFIETSKLNDNLYGSSIQIFFELINKKNYIIVLDRAGAIAWKKRYRRSTIIFIDCEEGQIEKRIKIRNPNENKDSILNRIEKSKLEKIEEKKKKISNKIFINNDLNVCLDEIEKYLTFIL